ncbi:glutathione synthetase-like isoform X2 [Corticium candelabrum]|nr:glutathione synthetase-like isoform X2 [Corticium candelabrum]
MMESRSDRWNGFTKMKQVEVNTIAAATGCLAERVPQLHRFTVSLRDGFCKGNYDLELPASENGKGMAEGLATAWKEYGSDRAVIVMLMCANEWNIYDMFHLEALLLLKFCVKLIQVNFDDIVEGGLKQATLREDGALIIDGYEVAVIYFRCGYVPEHYPSQKYWDARLLLELSQCIQCPSVALQLAGTKRVQQELAAPGVLERFVRNVDSVKQLRATFLNMYLLDQTPEGNNAAAKAIANPSDYVIKPQREGGGSNIYNEDVKKTLIDLKDSTIRGSYTMQDRIHPVETTNYFLRHGHLEELKPITVINETGIFGAFVRTGDDIVLNSVPGHYMRTKEATATEGSIRLGNTAIGSPWLN